MNHSELLKIIDNQHVLLVDIRDPSDQVSGVAKSAKCMTANELLVASDRLKCTYQQVMVMCYKGSTSKQLCDQLGNQFVSIDGGFVNWSQHKLPIEKPKISTHQIRYQQQIKLDGFGEVAQSKLAQSHVLVVGAGGLGSPALLYLAASGVGKITLIDDDVVSLSNLHRQILFQEQDIGLNKVTQAAHKLNQLNSTVVINPVVDRLNELNVCGLINQVDLVIDGSDNIQTRYLINGQCIDSGVPWIFAAVSGYEVQVSLFGHNPADWCYRCLFANISDHDADNCAQQGVLGSVSGMAAMIQVTEAIKYLTGLQTTLCNKMLTYNVLNHQFKVLKYPVQQQCQHR